MAEGFTLDRGYGRIDVASWLQGVPVLGWLGVKVRGAKLYPIATYRCPSCGFLESYAGEP